MSLKTRGRVALLGCVCLGEAGVSHKAAHNAGHGADRTKPRMAKLTKVQMVSGRRPQVSISSIAGMQSAKKDGGRLRVPVLNT